MYWHNITPFYVWNPYSHFIMYQPLSFFSNALIDVGIVTKQTHLRILRNIINVQIV